MIKEELKSGNIVKKNSKFILAIFLSILAVLLCSIAVFIRNGNVYVTDGPFHTQRIIGLSDALRNGQFPVKYYSNFYNGAGYLGPIFYGDLFLLFPALLTIMGVPVSIALCVLNYLIVIGIAISMYFLLKKYISNKIICVVGATIFVLSQYIFCDIFYRGAVGESIAIIFFIWLTIGIINMLKENFTKPWILSIAFLGFLFSHMTSLVIGAILLIIVVLINCKKLFPQKSFWLKSLLAFGIFIAIGLCSLVSFIEMYFADTYMMSVPWVKPSDAALNLFNILGASSYGGLGIICVLPLLLRLCIKKNENNEKTIKFIYKLLLISYIFILVSSNIFPWKLFDKIFSFMQFPWRLNIFPSITLVLAIALELNIMFTEGIKGIKIVLVCLLLFVMPFNNFYLMHFNDYDYNSTETKVYEWLPVCASNGVEILEVLDYDITLCDENDNKIEYTRKEHDTAVIFYATNDSNFYSVPIIYYKGYSAKITLNDDTIKELKVAQNKENGKTIVETNGQVGKVEVYYKGTALQNISLAITLISCVAVSVGAVVYHVVRKRRAKKKKLEMSL